MFVSSRMEELVAERSAVEAGARQAGFEPWLFESNAGARPTSPRTTYLQELANSDVYLGIFGDTLGEYTCDEFDAARRHGIPQLVYQRMASGSEPDPQLAAFLEEVGRVEGGVTIARFDMPTELQSKVAVDLGELRYALRRVHGTDGRVYTSTDAGGRYDRVERQTPIRKLPLQRSQAPLPPSPFVDRESAIGYLLGSLESGHLSVGVDGPSGAGKTALLRRLAHDGRWTISTFPDGVGLWLEGSRWPHVDDMLRATWSELHRVCDRHYAPDARELTSDLAGKACLILIDDVTAPPGDVERLTQSMRRSVFILAGQTDADGGLDPLSYITATAIGTFDEDGHDIEHFEARAEITLPERRRSDLLALLHDAGRLPGVITRLARDARAHVDGVDAWFDDCLQRSGSGAAPIAYPDRDPERRTLLLLGAFGPDLALPAGVLDGIGVETDTLQRLVQSGDAEVVDPGGYRVSAATYAAIGGEESAEPRRAEVFEATVAWSGVAGQDELLAHLGFLMRVLDWGVDDERHRQVMLLTRAVDVPMALAGAWGSWGVALNRSIASAGAVNDPAELGWALHERGTRALMLGERKNARKDLKRARRTRRRLGDRWATAVTRHNLNQIPGFFGRLASRSVVARTLVGAAVAIGALVALVLWPIGPEPIHFGEVAVGETEVVSFDIPNSQAVAVRHEASIDGDGEFCLHFASQSVCGVDPGEAFPGGPGIHAAAGPRTPVAGAVIEATRESGECALAETLPETLVISIGPLTTCTIELTFAPTPLDGQLTRDFEGRLTIDAETETIVRKLLGTGTSAGVPPTSTTQESTTLAPRPSSTRPSPSEFDVAVEVAGEGSGGVVSSPSGIDCGDVCFGSFGSGTPVTLTAVSDDGSVMAGWGGACEGSDDEPVCVIDGAAQAYRVIAVFDRETGPNSPPMAFDKQDSSLLCRPVELELEGEDADGDVLMFDIVDGPENGRLSPLTATGSDTASTTYTPSGGIGAYEDVFTFNVTDGEYTAEGTVHLRGTCIG